MPSEPDQPDPEPPQPGRREITLQNPGRHAGLALADLRAWLDAVLDEIAAGARSLGLCFMSDRAMRALNRDHRGQDKPTDVLSFPGPFASADPADRLNFAGDELAAHLGDVAIAVPTARRQAAARGHSLAREIRLLSLHGILHCLGHDHETDDGEMTRVETRLRRRWLDQRAPDRAVAS